MLAAPLTDEIIPALPTYLRSTYYSRSYGREEEEELVQKREVIISAAGGEISLFFLPLLQSACEKRKEGRKSAQNRP